MEDKDRKTESLILQNQNKINQLQIHLDNQAREEDQFLKDLNISLEQLSTFIENSSNFTEENWQQLNQHKQLLNDKLKARLETIRNPKDVKRNYASLQGIDRHWIHVR
ncbi:MAG: hypothetical protein H0X51_03040 [Parachlamydiaceae bacterium]|nr:hypothetical protein [Parachlamydiaceae bacterium]